MLTEEENARFMQTGKGTPMGELLRRYWHPIAAATEFEDKSTKQVRLMGEDLVLYKDRSGTYGLLELHCPHRRADLSYGFVEECGLRCSYHGWAFDEKGNCISQPFEDTVNGQHPLSRRRSSSPPTPSRRWPGCSSPTSDPHPAPLCPTGSSSLQERLRPDRARAARLQLAAGRGEQHRPGALRVAALQLVARAGRHGRATTPRRT